MDRLLIVVLGHRSSGKSTTWNKLFGKTIKTSTKQRPLEVFKSTFVDVFLVSGSPEEREVYVGDLIKDKRARIVLCSIQYIDEARETFDYFINKGFTIYVQWLNPGYKDKALYPDHLGLLAFIQYQHSIVSIRNGKRHLRSRVQELREVIHGWATSRKLTYLK